MSNFDDWKKQFDKQISVTLVAVEKTQVESAKMLLDKVEKRTPVGDPSLWHWPAPKNYVPGTLKASWSISQSGSKAGLKITIDNDQPYAERVEYGWSTQAPYGMLRISCLEWSSIINKTAPKYKV